LSRKIFFVGKGIQQQDEEEERISKEREKKNASRNRELG
jgi:hypothetical protein